MRFEKQVTIHAPRAVVWDFLWDIARLAPCVPGCQAAETLEPYVHYRATVQEKVGPFRVTVPLDIDILAQQGPERLLARARGRDSVVQSHVKVDLALALLEVDPQRTALQVQADVVVLGKLGTLGHSVIVRKGEEIVDQFALALQAELHKEGPPGRPSADAVAEERG
jgi:carbon monoxide dehydrogenase subunit G